MMNLFDAIRHGVVPWTVLPFLAVWLLVGCAPPPEFAHLQQARASGSEPYYGGGPKTAAQLEADRELLAAVDRTGVSRVDAARQAVGKGFELVGQGDHDGAMRRFNQAWLLDPDSYGVPWGYGIVAWERDGDLPAAQAFFAQAEAKAPGDPWLSADHGRILCQAGQPAAGLDLMGKALSAHPDNTKLAENLRACRSAAGNEPAV